MIQLLIQILTVTLISHPTFAADEEGFCSGPDDTSSCVIKPAHDNEWIQFERAVTNVKKDYQVHMLPGEEMACVQSPTGRQFKDKVMTINAAVNVLNSEFVPHENGVRWTVETCSI